MTALIVVLPLIVVVEISLQLHRSMLSVAMRAGISFPPVLHKKLLWFLTQYSILCKKFLLSSDFLVEEGFG